MSFKKLNCGTTTLWTITKDEILMHVTTWIDFKDIVLSKKKIQFQKVTYCMIWFI